MDSLDSPRPGLEGSHHLPPYSILCVALSHPHPNGFYPWDSQGGVPKLSRFGLPGLWELITPGSDLRLGWGLKQTCSSSQELSNCVSHSICTRRDRVDSRLFVVGSQIVSLTPDPSFDHNLCCRSPNGSCEVIFDIYTSKPSQWYKENLKARCFDLCNWALKLGSLGGLQVPTFGSVSLIFTLASKWGCDIIALQKTNLWTLNPQDPKNFQVITFNLVTT
jgi:hypothetical protein